MGLSHNMTGDGDIVTLDPDRSLVYSEVDTVTGVIELSAGGQSLHRSLLASFQSAQGANPFDFAASATQPLVSAVTVNASAYAAPLTYSYATAAHRQRIPIIGAPQNDIELLLAENGGYVNGRGIQNATGSGWGGMGFSDTLFGSQFMEFQVTASSVQLNVRGFGLSSNYFPIWVNGCPVAPTPANIADGALQVAFAARGTYRVAVGIEQSLGVAGVSVSEDDTVTPLATARVPVVVYGDSYTAGATSPARIGGVSLVGAISHVGGINAIPCGVTSTGYVNDGGEGLPLTHAGRLAHLVAVVRASKSNLVLIPAGYNDVTIGASASAIQSAAQEVIDYITANTTAKVIIFGAQPGKRNNSEAQQAVDSGLASAVASAPSDRVAFVPVSGATAPWITGTRDMANTSGLIAGNSRYYTGTDGVHLSPFTTAAPNIPANTTPSSGVEYLARRIVDSAIEVTKLKGW